jgi:hypothetical protein
VLVYYLPGTAGWDTTFGDVPTALWQPQVETSYASFGVRMNQFGSNNIWTSGMVIVVDACTNLANPAWSPMQTNTLTGDSFYFSDPQWTNSPIVSTACARREVRLKISQETATGSTGSHHG